MQTERIYNIAGVQVLVRISTAGVVVTAGSESSPSRMVRTMYERLRFPELANIDEQAGQMLAVAAAQRWHEMDYRGWA